MNEVWWYPLNPHGIQTIQMPQFSRPLYTSMRQGKPVVYVLVNPDNQLVEYTVQTVATGEPFDAIGLTPMGVIEPVPIID